MSVLMPIETPADQPSEPKAKLNPKDWNQKYSPGIDKREHAIAGVVIGLGAFFLSETALLSLGLSKKGAIILAIVFSITAAGGALYGKECWDSLGHGCADVWDMLCGVVAFFCVALPIIIWYSYRQLNDKGGLK